jgi:hypothetical protein
MAKSKVFSIRMPDELSKTIAQRAAVHRRSRNGEIIYMLESFIADGIQSDLDAITAMEKPRRSPS